MSVRDHDSIVVEDFRGLVDNGEDEATPQGAFITSQNNRFLRRGVKTREGTSLVYTIANIRRTQLYKKVGEAQRTLILNDLGQLFDSTNLSFPILVIDGMTDFSSVTIFNRAYITPHNGVTGLPGQIVYIYDGAGTARSAAGPGPIAFTLTLADSATSGSVEAGVHVVAVVFETSSGFITRHGGHQVIDNIGGRKLDVSTIGTGGPETVARILVSTKRILNFNGDIVNQTYFEIPGGRIPDNVTTTATVDFFDADLVNDVTNYAEYLETIPAGVGIGLYNGRMITWGSDANPSILYVSQSGEPEAINGVEGFATINPGDAGAGLKNCWEHRGQLVCQKSQRSYITADNGESAAFWSVTIIDASVGTEPHGVGQVLDFGFIVEDLVVVAHTTGIRLYNGVFLPPLTYSISDIWDRINKQAFNMVEVAINPIDNEIYVALPLDGATSPNYILYGDYTEGLSAETIKWDLWKFPGAPRTVVVEVDNTLKEATPRFGMYTGNVYKLDDTVKNDYGTAIDSWHEHALLPTDSGLVNHYTGVQLKVKGVGTLNVTLRGLDSVDTLTAPPLTMALANRRPTFVGFNFTSYRAAVKLRVNSGDDYYIITKFELLSLGVWE